MKLASATIENRRARHNYYVEDTLECGISLWGNEVKSIRLGSANIKESWATVQNGQLVLRGMHITKWSTSNDFDVDENRERVLLAHKSEIRKLQSYIEKDGYTLIPLKVYFSNGKCKVELGVCKGKHLYDKRETLKERQMLRDVDREMKERK